MEHFEMIPDLKVIKKLSGSMNNKKILPPIPSKQFLSASLNDLSTGKSKDFDFEDSLSTSYRSDFKNPGGFDICRLKAYKLISSRDQEANQNSNEKLSSNSASNLIEKPSENPTVVN